MPSGESRERMEPVATVESDSIFHQPAGLAEPDQPVVERGGFTFVEEDDVAFTLQLCREVHRLYGDYQEGGLPSGEYVLAGLTVTMEMLAVLSGSITDGMPAMRITVAAAQTREMLAVTFGRDPLEGPPESRYRAHYRSIVDESARALGSHPAPLPPGWADAALGRGAASPVHPGDSGGESEPVAQSEASVAETAGETDSSDPVRRSLLRRLFGRRSK